MKKVFKIAAIVIGVLIVLLLALPFLFRGKIATWSRPKATRC